VLSKFAERYDAVTYSLLVCVPLLRAYQLYTLTKRNVHHFGAVMRIERCSSALLLRCANRSPARDRSRVAFLLARCVWCIICSGAAM
jgi:hypothetical protein